MLKLDALVYLFATTGTSIAFEDEVCDKAFGVTFAVAALELNLEEEPHLVVLG